MKEKNTAWILLVVSGLMEIVWAYTMKLSHGFTVLWPSVITIAILIASFFLLAKAVNTLGIGLSYAVFTGIGVVGTTFISIFVLKEGASLLKMLSLGVLIIGNTCNTAYFSHQTAETLKLQFSKIEVDSPNGVNLNTA